MIKRKRQSLAFNMVCSLVILGLFAKAVVFLFIIIIIFSIYKALS
jgi:hypothetical protein